VASFSRNHNNFFLPCVALLLHLFGLLADSPLAMRKILEFRGRFRCTTKFIRSSSKRPEENADARKTRKDFVQQKLLSV
jgi:hypothetical protein